MIFLQKDFSYNTYHLTNYNKPFIYIQRIILAWKLKEVIYTVTE